MRKLIKIFLVLLYVTSTNHAFAINYYYQFNTNKTQIDLILGDSTFAYTFSRHQESSEETIERGLTRISIVRSKTNTTMWVEHKTKVGFLYFKYKPSGQNWQNTGVAFRRYSTFFKKTVGNSCNSTPTSNNQNDLAVTANFSEKQNFANLMFDQSCKKKLPPQEFNTLVDTTYTLMKEDLGGIKNPAIMGCLKGQGDESIIRNPFSQLRQKVSILMEKSNSLEDIKKDVSVPFPISCDFDGQAEAHCGSASEGQKDTIRFDVRCLKSKQGSTSKEESISLFMHEFSHTVRLPKGNYPTPLTENQITQLEAGNCNPMDVMFVGVGDADISKNKVVATENAKSTGAKKIAGDVVNPYSSFAERATTPPTTQTANIATNNLSSSNSEVSGASTASDSFSPAQQRSIASTSSLNTISKSTNSFSTTIPTLQQQAQYQNVKTYVDASVTTVAKKIAPIVKYVESPAFAATLPPTSFKNSNSGESAGVNIDSSSFPNAVTKSTTTNRSPETAKSASSASSSSGGNAVAGANTPANLGSSTSATGSASRRPAAVNKSANRLSSADASLNNAYALKVRKKLLSDSSYRNELRSKGVQIEFADGYKFETPGHTVLYTEKNGILVGDK